MSDATDTPEEQVANEGDDLRCGERLAEARREQQISVVEVAKELHLDEHKVRALERNEFEVLGAPVFAKGHLRKYSQLVGVDEDDVFADYYAMTRSDGMPPIVSRRKKIRAEMSPGPWIAVIVVILVAAAAYWWFVIRSDNTVVNTADPVQQAPEQESQPDSTETQPAQEQLGDAEPVIEDVVVEEPVTEPAVQIAEPEPAPADQIRVSLSFSGDCWTEISDADGEQLFFSMGRTGETVQLSGKPPITALFGNADNVEVLVNDSSYELPEPNSANRTVRVAILNQ
ncbi:MAG: helix-turn-helix domain-containing protein [Woeseiaceae bacterium]